MSLINQMLKDLDARRPRPAGAHEAALHGMGLTGDHRSSATLPWSRLALGAITASLIAVLLTLRPWFQPGGPQFDTGSAGDSAVEPLHAPVPVAGPSIPAKPAPAPAAARPAVDQVTADSRPARRTAKKLPVQPAKRADSSIPPAKPAIHLTPHQKAGLAFRRALELLDRGNDRAAEVQLRKALSLEAGLADARVQLAALLLREQRLVDAEMLLVEGLAIRADQLALAELYARLLVERGDNARALDVLDAAGAAHSDLAEVRALRAGILMKLGDARSAALDYRKALATNPQRAVWWIGLGVALEQAGDPARALPAYHRAQRLPLSTELYDFVVKRINALNNPRNRE